MSRTYATDVSAIVLDIETVGIDNAADFLEPVTPDARLKDPDKIAVDIEAKTAARVERLALDWNVARIACIGWMLPAISDEPEIRICKNEDAEALAIVDFVRAMHHRPLVTFNGKAFDLRFLVRRSQLLGVPFPHLDLGKYSRGPVVIHDLYLDLTFGEGHYDTGAMKRTLSMFCKRFGIPSDDTVSGKDVPGLIAKGEWEAVAAHCAHDLALTTALAGKLGVIPQKVQEALPL